MEIHFKETHWYSVSIFPEKEKEALEFCKAGKCDYPSDIVDAGLGDYKGPIDDTDSQMSLTENDGQSTIETLDAPGKEEWSNEVI